MEHCSQWSGSPWPGVPEKHNAAGGVQGWGDDSEVGHLGTWCCVGGDIQCVAPVYIGLTGSPH